MVRAFIRRKEKRKRKKKFFDFEVERVVGLLGGERGGGQGLAD
jgi:hypothetical protein